MYRYVLVLLASLCVAGSTAQAKGHGCWGVGYVGMASCGCYGYQVGYGCWGCGGGGYLAGYGCCGAGWAYGCSGGWSTGWMPVNGGCFGCYGGYQTAYGPYYSNGGYGYSPPAASPAQPPASSPQPVSPRAPESPGAVSRPAPATAPGTGDNRAAEPIGLPEEKNGGPARATIVVQLPAEANLSVNGVATHSLSGKRVLVSPPLEPNKEFHYTLRAEVVRDGQTVVARHRVAVRAGEEKHVTLEFAAPAAPAPTTGAANSSRPQGSTSQVDPAQPPLTRSSQPPGG